MNAWTLDYDGFDPSQEGLREALCTLGNGYLATRGAAPESVADGVHYPGTYAAGCYNRLRDVVAGEVVENESMVNLPNWLPLNFGAEDGGWLGEAGVDLLDQRIELDLRRGVLTRRFRVRDRRGRTTAVTQRRFTHMRHPHLCGLQMTVTPLDWSGTLRVRSSLDGAVLNAGVPRYRTLDGRHLLPVRAERVDDETVVLVMETNQSHIRIAEAARTRVWCHGRRVDAAEFREPGRIGLDLSLDARSGQKITVEKLVTVYTSRDVAMSDPAVEALAQLGWTADFDDMLGEHVLAWSHLWQRFRFVMHGGKVGALQRIRLHLFHMLQTVSINIVDLDVGVPARGLTGEAYRGHVLWDELFVFPMLNLRLPVATRALLRYRFRRLPWARHGARQAGHIGAMYPWQSGSDGREESQRLHLNPLSGRWIPDPTRLQRHVGLAVAYNVWQYYQATGDREFLSHYGAKMIVEVARFFADVARYDQDRDRYVIRGVMGPDEFHTGYPDRPEGGVDNNAYTNVMTVWVLLRALDVFELLPERRRTELAETLGMDPEEPKRWHDISRRMYVPMFDNGVISQFEGYERLAELDWPAYRTRYGDLRRLDRILESEGDDVNRYQASKQADVLMLFYLLSADELGELFDRLGYQFDRETIPRTIEYYLSRASHGSTLSAVVHTWVLARGSREQALEYFIQVLDSDIADIQGGTTAEGIHLAAMAGSADLLQRCFAGVETRNDALWLNPHWPSRLGTLEFDLRYRGHLLTLRITGTAITVSAEAGAQPAIRLHCRDQTALLHPGQTANFPHLGSDADAEPGATGAASPR